MINYMIDFIQHNLFTILAILALLIVLSFAFKNIRRVIYGGIATALTSLGFAFMHKAGLGFNSFYDAFTKVVYSSTRLVEEIQEALLINRSALSITVSLESDYILSSLYLCDTFYSSNFKMFFIELTYFYNEIKIQIKEEIETIKESLVKRVNRSSFNFVYRL